MVLSKIDTASTLVGFSVGIFFAYIFYNKPECISKMPYSDTCGTFKKEEVPCETKESESQPEKVNNNSGGNVSENNV